MHLSLETTLSIKEVQIVYRLFLVNCYLLNVPRLPSTLDLLAPDPFIIMLSKGGSLWKL